MITPSAYRMATIVVPCRISTASLVRLGGMCPVFFNSREKLGPGSSPTGNSGRLMWSRRLAASQHFERRQPRVDLRLPLRVAHQVVGQCVQQRGVVSHVPECVVAAEAQQASDATGQMVVINVQRDVGARRPVADRT